jgi:hypothetical protein
MGNLMIKKIKYEGDKYYFDSPEFTEGINIIEGDNGSGKSTLSYFIEYGLGGDIKYFSKNNKNEKYKQIVNDTNNYIELIININDEEFTLQRYINKNDIFIKFIDGTIKKYCVLRNHCTEPIFSDWLLSKLNIKIFELSLGASNWYFNFNDIFRLLNYDQDTDPKKIYKAPNSENFVTDSLIIRKSIFETLMGTSSDDYFLKMNDLNKAKLEKQEVKYLLDEFKKNYPNLKSTLESVRIEEETLIEQMEKLVNSRNEYQKENTKVNDKFKNIEESKLELIRLEIQTSQDIISKKNLQIEKDKIDKLLLIQRNEIDSINKSIFTHEKLNLFDFEICPFCASSVEKKDKKCLCGNDISENNYEKFLYDSSEYKEILKYKEKSLDSILLSISSISADIEDLNTKISNDELKIKELNEFLKSAIESIEYSGNSKIIESIDNKISETKEKIIKSKELVNIYKLKERKENDFIKKDSTFQSIKKSFEIMEKDYLKDNKIIIDNFNVIYNELMKISSCNASFASIDEDYNPILDGGDYREKSAIVPKRMMYYFTLMAMALKYDNIKHPKFLLMDTPEEAGIDNIAENIKLFDNALELSKNFPEDNVKDYQFILTTGDNNRCPKEYEKFIKLRFRKGNGDFILKSK